MNKALVIDNSEEICSMASLILGSAGYAAETAKNAADGLDCIKALQPDVVVLDSSLPEMADLRLLSKAKDASPKSRFVLLVSNPGDPTVEKARGFGGVSVAVKSPGVVSFYKTLQASLQSPAKPDSAGHAPGRAKILVVDDEEPIRTVLRRFLEKRGYEVKTANNGLEALKAIEAEKPVLVLLDVKMPGMDGLELLNKIKTTTPDIAVMMITGNSDEDIAKECMKRGAFDYIGKPLNFDYLENSVMAKILLLTS